MQLARSPGAFLQHLIASVALLVLHIDAMFKFLTSRSDALQSLAELASTDLCLAVELQTGCIELGSIALQSFLVPLQPFEGLLEAAG